MRNQIVAFTKTCKCRKGNACELMFHSLNSSTKSEQHIKIAPKPTAKTFKQHMSTATVKKNVAVLFAMAFMVTLNAGNFQSYMNKQNLDIQNAVIAESSVSDPATIGRRLLWVESEEEYNEKLNRSNRQAENMVVPPLHFLRPASRNSNGSKSENWNSTGAATTSNSQNQSYPPPLTYPSSSKCNSNCGTANSSSGKQSEYSRLVINLQKLINVSEYHNISTKFEIERDSAHGFKFSTDFLELPDIKTEAESIGSRKRLLGYNSRFSEIESKKRKEDIKRQDSINASSELTSLFKALKRRDDTFYILSFNPQHLFLSPSTYNKSVRPKISLLLPTAEPGLNGDIAMMQVDCEVFNTKELELKSDMIPISFRHNLTKLQMKPKHVPLFNTKTQGNIKLQDKSVKIEKPRVRTYFMVGPKNQAAAAVSHEKPRFVEFNKSLINSSSELSNEMDSGLHG